MGPATARAVRPAGPVAHAGPSGEPARDRFVRGDRYRARREWQRYEGTPQRDLFRALRERFLVRHRRPAARALDLGSGPGRFTPALGDGPSVRRIAVDLGEGMLRELPDRWPHTAPALPPPDRVRADALRPPFAAGAFEVVAALGNLVGFAEGDSDQLLERLAELVAPGGTVLLEVAPGPGERSRYLHRLPPSSVARLFRSPPGIVTARVEREGFREEPPRRAEPGGFQRTGAATLANWLERSGFRVTETLAVAPALGPDADRIAATARDPKAWDHLLGVEERIGRSPDRWNAAAAVLLAAVRPVPSADRSPMSGPRSEG